MTNDEAGLDRLFHKYRAACPDVEPEANFMPGLWRKIEGRRGFLPVFQSLARTAMAACTVLALLLLALNFAAVPRKSAPIPSYTDALMADHSVEKTYYAETIRGHSLEIDPSR